MRDGALDRNGNGIGWKWPLVKRDTWVFLVKQINRINRLSIIFGGSQIISFHWCLNISSHDHMFHPIKLIIHLLPLPTNVCLRSKLVLKPTSPMLSKLEWTSRQIFICCQQSFNYDRQSGVHSLTKTSYVNFTNILKVNNLIQFWIHNT